MTAMVTATTTATTAGIAVRASNMAIRTATKTALGKAARKIASMTLTTTRPRTGVRLPMATSGGWALRGHISTLIARATAGVSAMVIRKSRAGITRINGCDGLAMSGG